MKITIDTDEKEIVIHENIMLADFFAKLQTMIPKEEYKEYKIICNGVCSK